MTLDRNDEGVAGKALDEKKLTSFQYFGPSLTANSMQCAFDLETFRLRKFVGFLPDIQMHVGLVSSDCNLRFTLSGKCSKKGKEFKTQEAQRL